MYPLFVFVTVVRVVFPSPRKERKKVIDFLFNFVLFFLFFSFFFFFFSSFFFSIIFCC